MIAGLPPPEQPESRVEGWVSQPNNRGTVDIIWTCVVTTFLCTFTILCLNCPSRGEGFLGELRRKLLWVGIGISGPEFVLTAAVGQFIAARDSVAMFRELGVDGWTYRHAFFANMGGFELNCPDCPPFRINSKHIRWLVKRGYISTPEVSPEELWDKSKQDTLTKAITCLQSGYVILTCIGRSIQGLALTTLELSTMAVVVCSIMTSICWLRKPQDVRYPVRITMSTPMAQILREAGPIAARPYRQTPLDFVDDYTPSWSLNVHKFMGFSSGDGVRPLTRVGDSKLPRLTWKESSYLCLATLLYASIHMAGWNFTFPSRTEQLLLRISSAFLVGTTVVFWLVESVAKGYRSGFIRNSLSRAVNLFQPSAHLALMPPTSLEEGKVPSVKEVGVPPGQENAQDERPFVPAQLPLKWEFWGIVPIAVAYAFARGYILVEALLGLRSLPESAYLGVDWLSLIPHL